MIKLSLLFFISTQCYCWGTYRHNYNQRSRLRFPDEYAAGYTPKTQPADFIAEDYDFIPQLMERSKSMDDFLQQFSVNPPMRSVKKTALFADRLSGSSFGISSRFGGEEEPELTYPEKLVICEPLDTVVPLTMNNTKKGLKYLPPCVVAKRCRGCESSNGGKECVPTRTETLHYKVAGFKMILSAEGRQLEFIEDAPAQVEQHLNCEMRCNLQPADCPHTHRFVADICRCKCKNTAKASDCRARRGSWHWDEANCVCLRSYP